MVNLKIMDFMHHYLVISTIMLEKQSITFSDDSINHITIGNSSGDMRSHSI